MRQTILIIGGGASGGLAALHLLKVLKERRQSAALVIIEPAEFIARGVAYSTRRLTHLLNVPVGNMSAFESEPDHFLRYVRQKRPELRQGSFVPRIWFGEYLGSLLPESQIQHIRKTAVGLTRNTRWEVKLNDSSSLSGDTVILAPGNLKPPTPSELSNEVIESSAWMQDAWDEKRYEAIKPEARVGILGTGLTMVDVVKTLREIGHHGKITALSRRGLLPQVHQSKKSLQTIAGFENEKKLISILSELRKFIRLHEKNGGAWQDCMQALRPITSKIWQDLPDPERKRFLRHLKPYWEVHRHRQPQESVDFLDDLIQQGSLEVKSGRIRGASINGAAGVTLKIWNSLSLREESFSFDHLINATGAIADFRHSSDPLILGLQKNGWLLPHHLGLGLTVNENFQIIGKNGPTPGIFTLGNPTKGLLWESTAIPDIRKQAAEIARTIISL